MKYLGYGTLAVLAKFGKSEEEKTFETTNGLVFRPSFLAEGLLNSFIYNVNITDPADVVNSVLTHGCWCAKLDSTNAFTEFLGGPDSVDELDEICRDWFKCRNCNDRLEGGSCNIVGSNSRELLLAGEYHLAFNASDYQSTATCTYGADQCSDDSCTIDLYYAKQITEYVEDNVVVPIVVTDNSTCTASVKNDIVRVCDGYAPYLKPIEKDGAAAFIDEGWSVPEVDEGEVDDEAIANGATHIAQGGAVVFKLFYESLTWFQARDKCIALGNGASLAAIYSEAEHLLVHALGASDRAWLGGNDQNSEGSWRWVQGANTADEPMTYTRWRSGEPNQAGNEDCTEKYTDGDWNDIPCGSPKPAYICQIRF